MKGGLALVAAVAAFLFPKSACRAEWTAKSLVPTTVSYSYQCTTTVAAGPNGSGIAAYLDDPSGQAYVNVRRSGAWGGSRGIYQLPTTGAEQITEISVSMGGDGSAIAAFTVSHFERRNAYSVVMASVLPSGSQSWTTPAEVSGRGAVHSPRLASDATGNVLLLWADSKGMQFSRRIAGGAWTPVAAVPGCPRIDAMAMNSAGTAVVGWMETATNASIIHVLRMSSAGDWQSEEGFSGLDGTISGLRIGLDASSLVGLACLRGTGAGYEITLFKETALGVWARGEVANDPALNARNMDFGMDESGGVVLGWNEDDPSNGQTLIHAQARPAGGGVEESTWTPADGVTVAAPTVALSKDGALAAIAWIDDWDGHAYASVFSHGMGWSPAGQIGWGLYENTVSLACGEGMSAIAAWPLREPTWREFAVGFNASTFRPVPSLPKLNAISLPMTRPVATNADITITGARFFTIPGGADVVVDGAGRSADVTSSSALTAHLEAGDLSAEGVHRLLVRNHGPEGGVSGTGTIVVDGTAPTTSVVFSGKRGSNGWYQGQVKVALTAKDPLTGVRDMSVRLDGQPFPTATNSPAVTPSRTVKFVVKNPGVHALEFSSTDPVGNVEPIHASEIRIDDTPPVLNAVAQPSVLTAGNGDATAILSGTVFDLGSGVDPAGVSYEVSDKYGTCQPAGSVSPSVSGDFTIPLKLDARKSTGDGVRTYKITVTARDLAGGFAKKTVSLSVR